MARKNREKDDLVQVLDRKKTEITTLCSKLISKAGENPPGDTSEVADFVKAYLEKDGFSVVRFEPFEGRPNLVCTIGPTKGRHFILCGHLDVFPAGSGWKVPPFSGRVSNGKIYGRGAVDMKAGIAASVFAFKTLARIEKNLEGKITLALFSDEENMGFKGAQWMMANHKKLLEGDSCLIGEPARLDAVTIAEKGIIWMKIKSAGELAHGAYGGGTNSIVKLAWLIAAFEKFKNMRGSVPMALADIQKRQTEIFEKDGAPDPALLDHIWVNAGTIKGGHKINLVPQICEAELDMRIPLGMSIERDVIPKIRRLLEGDRRFRNMDYEMLYSVEPNMTSPKSAIAISTIQNITEITGLHPNFFIRLGSTDAKFFRSAGVPTVTYGPDSRTMGEVGEFVRIEELKETAKVHLGVAYDQVARKPV